MIKLFIYFWVTLIGCLLTNKLPNIVTMTLYVAEMHAQKFRVGKSSTLYLNRDAKPATVFPGHCFPPSLFLNPNSLSLSVSQDSIRFLSSLYGPTHLFNIFLFVFSREKFLSPPKTPTTPSAPLSHNGFNLNWNSLIDAHFSLSPFLPCINYITQYTTSPPPHHCTFLQYTSLSLFLSLS